MPRFPGAPDGSPEPTQPPTQPPTQLPTPAPVAGDPSHREAGDAALRAAATELGFDFDSMSSDDREFVELFHNGALAALPNDTADPENPLIPGNRFEAEQENAPVPTSVPDPASGSDPDPTTASPAGPTTDDGAGSGVRTGDAASAGAPALKPSQAAPSGAPAVQPSDDQYVAMDFGQGPVMVPVAYAQQAILEAQQNQLTPEEINFVNAWRQGLVQPSITDPRTGAPTTPPQPSPTFPPAAPPQPQGQLGLPAREEWADPAAYDAIAYLTQQQQAQGQLVQQWLDAQTREKQAEIDRSIQTAASNFATNHDDLSPQDIYALFQHATQFNMLAGYAQHYPGNPVGAVEAALENALWSHPQYRERAIQARYAAEIAETAEVEAKKAAAAGLVSSAGTQPRVSAPPRTEQERMMAMAAAIEADMQGRS